MRSVFFDDADVIQVHCQRQQDHIGIWRVYAMSGVFVEEFVGLGVTKEVHNLVLTLSWRTAIRVHHNQFTPLSAH